MGIFDVFRKKVGIFDVFREKVGIFDVLPYQKYPLFVPTVQNYLRETKTAKTPILQNMSNSQKSRVVCDRARETYNHAMLLKKIPPAVRTLRTQ